jgi:hypothetical protein
MRCERLNAHRFALIEYGDGACAWCSRLVLRDAGLRRAASRSTSVSSPLWVEDKRERGGGATSLIPSSHLLRLEVNASSELEFAVIRRGTSDLADGRCIADVCRRSAKVGSIENIEGFSTELERHSV